MARYMIWEVGEDHREHDCSDLSPEQVADRLTAMLTDPEFFNGERCFSLGVRALADGATSLADEPSDVTAQGTYMQCEGNAENVRLEVRITTPDQFEHISVFPAPDQASTFEPGLVSRARKSADPSATEFSPQQAAEVFRHYILTGQVPARCNQSLLEKGRIKSRRFWRR